MKNALEASERKLDFTRTNFYAYIVFFYFQFSFVVTWLPES
ncbi:hypothetical protein HMPREF1870_00515 [Bacteroidales bacterium KA00344]|nr:hypothetical protein HMPREF1870_00515 [Bacteroidales bacterium KA00344]